MWIMTLDSHSPALQFPRAKTERDKETGMTLKRNKPHSGKAKRGYIITNHCHPVLDTESPQTTLGGNIPKIPGHQSPTFTNIIYDKTFFIPSSIVHRLFMYSVKVELGRSPE
jgi:hypothetical protein